jgi:hypothetical protein
MAGKPLEGRLGKKVTRMVHGGAEPEEVAAMLVARGWDPDDARAAAAAEDRRYQDTMREDNMARTHVPRRNVVRTGGSAAVILFALWAVLKVIRLLSRYDDD